MRRIALVPLAVAIGVGLPACGADDTATDLKQQVQTAGESVRTQGEDLKRSAQEKARELKEKGRTEAERLKQKGQTEAEQLKQKGRDLKQGTTP
jgi:F0F1-type ATP synthase membrane subunit b/b'